MPRNRGPGSRTEREVARRYGKAGYNIRRNKMRPGRGEIDIIATRGHDKRAIEVKGGRQTITSSDIEKFYQKAKGYGKTLYLGKHVQLTEQAKKLARKYGIKIRSL